MGALTTLQDQLEVLLVEARGLNLQTLFFAGEDDARLGATVLIGLAGLVLLLRLLTRRSSGRGRLALPSLIDWARPRRLTLLRHGALIFALAGIPFFALAFADPKTALTREQASYPGRRISLMIDASSSMLSSMPSSFLAKGAPNDAMFFTTVGAARRFVELRMKGKYRDMLALIEFGDQAYVITPFTTDYENILFSMSLIGDWTEFMTFPDQGTVIANAIEQSVGMFRAFDVLDAAGNAMVIFTDGIDAEVTEGGRTAFDVLQDARNANIPVFFIRMGTPGRGPQVTPDDVWAAAVAKTGGKFFNAADESAIVRAVNEIDKATAGRVEMKRYSTEQPRFASFAMAAAMLWSMALLMRLTMPWFQTFP
ncbi:MAG: VWA domain-containing protein [Acidobacteria bacterium]|nr:VWA domain-containing protein [Acidobacteriota bacterium]